MSDDAEADRLLRAALDQPEPTNLLGRLSRASLMMFAGQVPGQEHIVAEYMLPNRAELDLHLDGSGVRGHETRADEFGQFVQRVAKSVQATARSSAGRDRMKTNLQVVGPAAGSVRVVFRAPEVADTRPTDDTGGLPLRQQEPVEALALRTLASLLGQAESDDGDLAATLQGLDRRARGALRLVAKTVQEAGWSVTGELKKRGWGTTSLTFSADGAERVIEATDQREVEQHTEPFSGKVDGWAWSDLTVRVRIGGGTWLKALVIDPRLQQRVAELLQTPEQWVDGTVNVVTSTDQDTGRTRLTRVLLTIKEARDPEPVPGLFADSVTDVASQH